MYVLKLARQCELPATPSTDRTKAVWPSKSNDLQDSPQNPFVVSNPRKTLIVICCSKGKDNTPHPPAAKGDSNVDYLPELLAERLRKARCEIARKAGVDESNLVPACRRYTGHLYQVAAHTIERAVYEGTHLVILSGAYGILLSHEPIGFYDRKFSRRDWPDGLLERFCWLLSNVTTSSVSEPSRPPHQSYWNRCVGEMHASTMLGCSYLRNPAREETLRELKARLS